MLPSLLMNGRSIVIPLYPKNPLTRIESTQSLAALLAAWGTVAGLVQAGDPERFACVTQALVLNLPFDVLKEYVCREVERALEAVPQSFAARWG